MLKVHGRCDLACDYCYMYRAADQRWRDEPRTMSPAVVEWTAARIAEHAHTHRLPRVAVSLHGGEPLLAGADRITRTVESIRAAVGPRTRTVFTLQTNAVRLTARHLDLLGVLDVGVSVSLDGDRAAHDRHRRYADGRGSHAQVAAALRLLRDEPHRALFAGLLCTVDLANDPLTTYQALLDHQPPAVDFLLPHGNWSTPPPGRHEGAAATPYADWLIPVFDRWYNAPRRETRVRMFDEILVLLLGGAGRVEGLGLSPVGYAVVEPSGALTQDDALRTAYPGAVDTGLHVARNSFDEALRLPGVVARQSGAAALAAGCRRCDLHQVCGGGHYPHRYRANGSGFDNPSVYCPDLTALIRHVRARVATDVTGLAVRAAARHRAPHPADSVPAVALRRPTPGAGSTGAPAHGPGGDVGVAVGRDRGTDGMTAG